MRPSPSKSPSSTTIWRRHPPPCRRARTRPPWRVRWTLTVRRSGAPAARPASRTERPGRPDLAAPPVPGPDQHGRRDDDAHADEPGEDDGSRATRAVGGRIVMGERADHPRGVLVAVTGGQRIAEVLPLPTALGNGAGHGLGEVLADSAARRRRVGGLARDGVDETVVLVQRCMGDPVGALTDAGDLVPEDEAAGREP